MIAKRIEKIQNHRRTIRKVHRLSPKTIQLIRPAQIRATFPGPEKDLGDKGRMFEDQLRTAYIAFQTKSLDDDPYVPRLVKWLLRRIYHHYGWTAMAHDGRSYCKWEFLGVYDTATEARWAAMVPGGSWMELPLNQSLPEETSQFGAHDFPRSSVSAEYRNRKLPFITLPRKDFEALDEKVMQTLSCAHGKCEVKAV